MSKQVNVRLDDFYVNLLNAIQSGYEDMGKNISQAKIIESALDHWLITEPNLRKSVSEKMDLGFFSDL